jgi:hypothetical protein
VCESERRLPTRSKKTHWDAVLQTNNEIAAILTNNKTSIKLQGQLLSAAATEK